MRISYRSRISKKALCHTFQDQARTIEGLPSDGYVFSTSHILKAFRTCRYPRSPVVLSRRQEYLLFRRHLARGSILRNVEHALLRLRPESFQPMIVPCGHGVAKQARKSEKPKRNIDQSAVRTHASCDTTRYINCNLNVAD